MAVKCLGCVIKHLANASILLQEVLKFHSAGKSDMVDKHLFTALGELGQAESQIPSEMPAELTNQIREIRKRVEVAGILRDFRAMPELIRQIEDKGPKLLHFLRKMPELCPTCKMPEIPEVKHEAFH